MTQRQTKKVHTPSKGRGATLSPALENAGERGKEIKASLFMVLSITIVLLVFKGLIERTDTGRLVEQMSYDLLQHHLTSVASAKDLPVIVLDISPIPILPVTGGLQPQSVTARAPLSSIVKSLIAKNQPPEAIGLDVDFSPDRYGYASPEDPKFFDDALQLTSNTHIPILVGVNKSLALGPNKWLMDPKYMSLAACIVVPTPDTGESTRYMPESLTIQYPAENGDAANTSQCPSMGATLAKASIAPLSWWARYFLTATNLKAEGRVSGSDFLVDYSPLDALSATAPEVHDAADVANIDVTNKIVLLGRTKETNDTFTVPGKPEKAYPGVFLHACAVYTLLRNRPLYRLTEPGRILMDLLFSAAIFGTVLGIRLQYATKSREEFMEHRLPGLLSFFVVVILVFGAVAVVRVYHLMWDDFLLVAVVLVAHSPMERTTGEFARWIGKFLRPAKQHASAHHSEEQK